MRKQKLVQRSTCANVYALDDGDDTWLVMASSSSMAKSAWAEEHRQDKEGLRVRKVRFSARGSARLSSYIGGL